MHLLDMDIIEVDGSKPDLGSLPEAATATTSGTPDWCTGFGSLSCSREWWRAGPFFIRLNMSELSPCLVCTGVSTERRSKTELRSDYRFGSSSVGFTAELPRFEQMMAPPVPLLPLLLVSGDFNFPALAADFRPKKVYRKWNQLPWRLKPLRARLVDVQLG